jgi:hypothetical protein
LAATAEPNVHSQAQLAEEDELKPTYSKADLEKALIDERGAEATGERQVDELEAKGADDQLRIAQADLAVRRRFIATLEACQEIGHSCPPRLDDPPWKYDVGVPTSRPTLDAPLRFELADWQKLAAELHGRACACRTQLCVDSLGVAIDELEQRPMMDVRGDETASASITRARECLFRLRGKTVAKHTVAPVESD